jgi:hypothetical protein
MYQPVAAWGQGNPHDLIDQTTEYISGSTDINSYLHATSHPHALGNQWAGGGGQEFDPADFDLGSSQLVSGMVIWSGDDFYHQSLSMVWVSVRDESSQTWTDLGWFGSDHTYASFTPFSQPVRARYIHWNQTWNDGNGRTTLIQEVAFTIVPEPGCLAVFGLGCIAVVMRRRRI